MFAPDSTHDKRVSRELQAIDNGLLGHQVTAVQPFSDLRLELGAQVGAQRRP